MKGRSGRRAGDFWPLVAAALLLAGLALPWAGWFGVRSAGFAVGLAGAIGAMLWSLGLLRHGEKLAIAAGLLATVLIGSRLISTPADPLLAEVRSTGGLTLGLVGSVLLAGAGAFAAGERPRRASLGSEQRRGLATVAKTFAVSRVLVWASGALAVAIWGIESTVSPPPITVPFGAVGDAFAAPASAWDAGAYLQIAQTGYATGGRLLAFFPLYPGLVRSGAWSPEAALVTGVLVSLAAFAAALYVLHRLVALDFDATVADRAVTLTAFSPMALYFSAVYTEALFLLLSVAAVYAARSDRWVPAAALGGLAAATRPTGVLLLVPLAVLYLYGPATLRSLSRSRGWAHWRRPDPRIALLALVPAGLVAFLAYCGVHGDFAAPLHAQETYWQRGFGPLEGMARGLRDAWRSVQELVGASGGALPAPDAGTAGQLSRPANLAFANLTDFAFLLAAVGATAGALRHLPLAYGLYAAVTLAVVGSTYYEYEPLASVPRFVLVLFPCYVWLALRTSQVRVHRATLALSALLLVFFSGRFATWHWVA